MMSALLFCCVRSSFGFNGYPSGSGKMDFGCFSRVSYVISCKTVNTKRRGRFQETKGKSGGVPLFSICVGDNCQFVSASVTFG